jgi:hypothetical protein
MCLKIDVQGYELHALRGAPETLSKADFVIIETTFISLYSGQPLFDDIYRYLRDSGFIYHGALEQLLSPIDGRPLQADALFLKQIRE